MSEESFEVSLQLEDGYRFLVDFGLEDVSPLATDEPPPLGEESGPNPSRLLAAAVANCLGASLLFCLRKARIEVSGLRASVAATTVRNERGRLRIGGLTVTLHPQVAPEDRERLERCLGLYEEFCVVSQSVRQGVPIEVSVEPAGAPA